MFCVCDCVARGQPFGKRLRYHTIYTAIGRRCMGKSWSIYIKVAIFVQQRELKISFYIHTMKQGKPSITAPLSKKSNDNNSSFIGLICAVISAIIAFVGTLLLCISVMSSSTSNTNITQNKSSGSIRSVIEKNTQPNGIIPLSTQQPKGLIIHTHLGDIRIQFTPELSGESSINYIKEVVQIASSKQNSGMAIGETANERRVTEGYKCSRCKFYRAEKQLLLQGIIAQVNVPKNKELGPCPLENYKPKNKCPEHDPNCGCHGPIMTKGTVGWAGGGGGPDFFINTFKNPVDWWENQHTVWGKLDDASIKLVESIYDLPVHGTGMKMLDEEIEISLELF